MAPEIYTRVGHGKPVDLWAIGVITYFLLCGYIPFEREKIMLMKLMQFKRLIISLNL
jgi:serine/threonine protein kinase